MVHRIVSSFTSPACEDRRIFVFSDAPHLMKCVRNRLMKEKVFCVNGTRVFWSHYDKLYVVDTKNEGCLRVFPKLSFSHLNPSNTEKMRVKLATQLFSMSVAKGLEFYSDKRTPGLENVKGTVDFTVRMNNVFDAMNRRHAKDGLRLGGKDFEELESFLKWLNDWEEDVKARRINPKNFLSQTTAEGLRVTVLSTIQLSNYLLKKCDFKYVLTAKFNQDVLEKFFGVIRQAGGQNEHPCLPTFLQLYSMLSIYSLVKPPKYGNCQLLPSEEPRLLTLSDLTSAFKDDVPSQSRLDELKSRLDGFVQDGIECEDIFDCVPASDSITDCIIYYVCGFLCRKLLKNINCSMCKLGLIAKGDPPRAEGALIVLKTRGGLAHPNAALVHLLKETEQQFQKHAGDKQAYDLTIDFVLDNYNLSFPCHEHKVDIMAQVLHYYVGMRMRQYCKQLKKNESNKSQKLRKLSKLVQ